MIIFLLGAEISGVVQAELTLCCVSSLGEATRLGARYVA